MTPDGITFVIGGSRGIGAATATLVAEQGRKVIVVDILPEPALETGIAWGALSKERLIRNAAMIGCLNRSRSRRPSAGYCRRPAAALPASIFPSTPAFSPARRGMRMADCAKHRPVDFEGPGS